MRSAAALVLAALSLPGCSPARGDEATVTTAAMDQLAADFRGEALCLHHSFGVRVPHGSRPGVFVEGQPPAGFEALEERPANSTELRPEELRGSLPDRWHIGDGGKEMCFEFSYPIMLRDRALVSVEIHQSAAGPFGRRNYWLLRKDGRWVVADRTEGHWDI